MKLKKIIALITSFVLLVIMVVPVMANTFVEKTNYADLYAFNNEYIVSVRLLLEDPDYLHLEVRDSNGNILVADNTIPSTDLSIKMGVAVVSIPEYDINLTWTYTIKDAQIGRLFLKNFPDTDSRYKDYSIYSDSDINELTATGTLLGNSFTSTQGYLLTFYTQILYK